MTDTFIADAIVFRLDGPQSDDDRPAIYLGHRSLRLETDRSTLVVDNDLRNDGEPRLFVDEQPLLFEADGTPIAYEEIAAGSVTVDGAAGTRETTLFVNFQDEGNPEFQYLVTVSGPGIPTPAPGTDIRAFLAGFAAEFGAPPFAPGTRLDLDAIEGLRLEGGGASIGEATAVALLYDAALDRNGAVDLPGLNFWIDRFEGPVTLDDGRVLPQLGLGEIAERFLAAPEFVEAYGNALDPAAEDYLSDEDLVRQLYRNVLDREGDEAGVSFWVSQLARPEVDRGAMLLAFADSAENRGASTLDDTIAEAAESDWTV